jgi:secretion/DNA translocation related TadE-like protein
MRKKDYGFVSIIALTLLLVVCIFSLVISQYARKFYYKQQSQIAADSGAIAAMITYSEDGSSSQSCLEAKRIVAENNATMVSCKVFVNIAEVKTKVQGQLAVAFVKPKGY